jgi:hypothetical protein
LPDPYHLWGALQACGYVETPGKAFTLVRNDKLGEWMSLRFRLEPAPPHRLVGT